MITPLIWDAFNIVNLVIAKCLWFPFYWNPAEKQLYVYTKENNFLHLILSYLGIGFVVFAEFLWLFHFLYLLIYQHEKEDQLYSLLGFSQCCMTMPIILFAGLFASDAQCIAAMFNNIVAKWFASKLF